MGPPLIGVTTSGRHTDGRYSIPAEYVEAVRRAGGVPVLLAPGESAVAALVARLDGVVLSGGGDIAPELYGAAPHPSLERIDPERDTLEIALVHALLAERVPTLSICRGCQVVNVALGGTLHQHLPDVVGEALSHKAPEGVERPRHEVAVDRDSRLAAVMGSERPYPVSSHHQAPDRVPPALRIVARADDGTIEALEAPDHPWFLAVQWHPELSAAEDASQQRLFDGLVAAARERRQRRPSPVLAGGAL
jgi:putative glutamine amidotransferase